jgi:hypothetical protein
MREFRGGGVSGNLLFQPEKAATRNCYNNRRNYNLPSGSPAVNQTGGQLIKRLIIVITALLLFESIVFAYTRKYKIEGYSDKISYTQGDTAYFSISMGAGYESDTLAFDYEVYRFGASTDLYAGGADSAYYHVLNLQQPYNNHWDTTFTIEISRGWPSGVYGVRYCQRGYRGGLVEYPVSNHIDHLAGL